MADPQSRAPAKTEPKLPYNASDPEQIRAKEKTSAATKVRRIAGLKLLVESPDGRVWLRDLFEFCGVYRLSFTGNSETFFREGTRNVGLKIHADLVKHFPESYITMLKEGESNV